MLPTTGKLFLIHTFFSHWHSCRCRPKCPQPSEPNNSKTFQSYLEFPADVTESEFDCLNLFVVTPSRAALNRLGHSFSNNGLPVFLWIHGGGYGFGAGTDPMWGRSEVSCAPELSTKLFYCNQTPLALSYGPYKSGDPLSQ
jgi:hypothetical protein